MSIDILLDLLNPCLEDPTLLGQRLRNALYGAQVLRERPSLFWRMGRERAVLFAYAIYSILSRASPYPGGAPPYQSQREEVIAGLEKAYSSLKETVRRNLTLSIILDEQENIGYCSHDVQLAKEERRHRGYVVQLAHHGYIQREAERIYQTFAHADFSHFSQNSPGLNPDQLLHRKQEQGNWID